MVRWLCRWDLTATQNWTVETNNAQKLGIEAWLLPLSWDGINQWQVHPLAEWLLSESAPPQSFCLEWEIPHPLSPAQEVRAAEVLAEWLASSAALRQENRPVLVLADPQHLSHGHFALPRLRSAINAGLWRRGVKQVCLLLAANSFQGMDGVVTSAERDITCQLIDNKLNYESFLFHANQLKPCPSVRIEAVLPLLAEQEEIYAHSSATNYREWLEIVDNWLNLLHAHEQGDHWLLIESWRGHSRWFALEETTTTEHNGTKLAPKKLTETINWGKPQANHHALLVHGFYLDQLNSILERLPQGEDQTIDLYLSTPLEKLEDCAVLVQRLGWKNIYMFGVENRGRDIAPFLNHILPMALANGHHTFVKLHTKSSPHLVDGNEWAEFMINSLFGREALVLIDAMLEANPQLGLLAPAGTLLPMGLCVSKNVNHLKNLLTQANLTGRWFLNQQFIAGSMMAGRLAALKPLIELSQPLEKYEAEYGQTDGTLAHAMERLLSGLPAAFGYQLKELPGNKSTTPSFGYGWLASEVLGLS